LEPRGTLGYARWPERQPHVDPLVPRLSFLSFTRTKTLRELDYSPDGVEPFQAGDFKSRD